METFTEASPIVKFAFPNWKRRAFTMAYDDGTIHDKRMVEILNQYGIKGTFYISAGRAGTTPYFLSTAPMKELYKGHEIGSHGYKHLVMTKLTAEEMESELVNDLAVLEKLTDAPIRSFAYPYGAYNEELCGILKRHGIICARTTGDSLRYSNLWQDFSAWHPTAHHDNPEIFTKLNAFLAKDIYGGCLGIFSCWGHSYEFDKKGNWEQLEKICQLVSAKKDILWLVTNGELFEYLSACQKVQSTIDGSVMYNPTNIPIYYYLNETEKKILQPNSVAVVEMVNVPCPESDALLFPGGRPKALTFSYDDGSDADAKLLEIFNQYKVKGTFNVNSKRFANFDQYKGHEVAGHSFSHSYYSLLPRAQALQDIYADKVNIESHIHYPVRGYAYPNGDGPCYCDSQVEMLRSLDFAYARGTGVASDSFPLPVNWYNWSGNTRNVNADFMEMGDKFLATKNVPALLYVWGHSFELVKDWSVMTKFLDKMANHEEIWYATNIEIHDYVEASRSLVWAQDKSFVYNPTAIPVYYAFKGRRIVIKPGLNRL